jgi:formyltetrahydrofolate deformylase
VKPSVLLVECADRAGLVHAITGVLFRRGVNVVGNQEFVDRASGRFFMRTEFDGDADAGALVDEVRSVIPAGASVRFSDILVRHAFGELNAQVLAVISNHATLADLVLKFDLPFHHLDAAGVEREAHEASVLDVIASYRPEYLVLAKYMRILGGGFVSLFPSRVINIHHSFLPAFVGAKPYHQAFARGVKVIGATAHYVTEQLDAGPIIVQQVIPVDHTHAAEDLAQAGRDVEQLVLARALRLVFEDRVFLCGNRTVIFD